MRRRRRSRDLLRGSGVQDEWRKRRRGRLKRAGRTGRSRMRMRRRSSRDLLRGSGVEEEEVLENGER